MAKWARWYEGRLHSAVNGALRQKLTRGRSCMHSETKFGPKERELNVIPRIELE